MLIELKNINPNKPEICFAELRPSEHFYMNDRILIMIFLKDMTSF